MAKEEGLSQPLLLHLVRPLFWDRQEAGRRLAERLTGYPGAETVVFAIPRGGVAVAREICHLLGAPLELVVVRKLGIPSDPEAGYGAVTDDGTVLLNEPLVRQLRLSPGEIQRQAAQVKAEIDRRTALYRTGAHYPRLDEKTAILVDDGLATGFTMVAALESLRRRSARRVVVAVPVAAMDAWQRVAPLADEAVTLAIADTDWFAVASFYRHWHDLTDQEVIALLRESRRQRPAQPAAGAS